MGKEAAIRSLLAAALLGAAALPAGAESALGPAEVTARIEAAYPVSVLAVREVTDNGRPAYAVVVMNDGGTYNEAFQVNTLIVDRATGKLLPQFRHGAGGHEDNVVVPSREWPRRGRTSPPGTGGQ